VIAGACILVTWFIMAKVVPTFMNILDGLDTKLPPLTLMVRKVSTLAANPHVVIGLLVTIITLAYGFTQYRKTPQGQYRTDQLMLRVPVFGPLLRTFILARVSRGLAVMLRNGIPLDDALNITSGLAANEVYRRHFREIRRQAIDGQKMFPVMAAVPRDFPEQYWLQFRAAEEKAKLKETLNYLGEMYNDEVTSAVESLTATLEPFLMIFLGGVVGVIVVSVFLPMTTMMEALQ
jgi:type IV pilus assembly protein PilC